jgi:hypothetical protein
MSEIGEPYDPKMVMFHRETNDEKGVSQVCETPTEEGI